MRPLILLLLLLFTTTFMSWAQESPEPDVKATIKTDSGVETVEFDTLTGTVEVNLPDDLSDTDTISGTVVVEPKGETKEEIAHNEAELTGYVVEIEKAQTLAEPPCPPQKSGQPCPATVLPKLLNQPPTINLKQKPPFTCKIPAKTGTIIVKVKTAAGKTICQQPVKCNPQPLAAPATCEIPSSATCGQMIRIPGKCDGRMATSQITVKGKTCPMIAESPRQQICMAPLNLTGPCPIVRTECGMATKGFINMLPKPTTASTPQQKSSPARVVLWRTGPFITTHPINVSKMVGPIQATANRVSVTFPLYHYQGSKMLPATIDVAIPPEKITVGDSFTLPLSMSGDENAMMHGGWLTDQTWITNNNVAQGKAPVYLNPINKAVTQTNDSFTVIDFEARLKEYLKANPGKSLPAGVADSQPYLEFKGTVGPDGAANIKWIYMRKRPQIE